MKKFILFFTVIFFFAFMVKAQSNPESKKNADKELAKEIGSLSKNVLKEVKKCQKDFSREIKRAIRIRADDSEENFLKAKLLLGSTALLESKLNQDILIIQLSVNQLDDKSNVNTKKIKKNLDKICEIRKNNNQ